MVRMKDRAGKYHAGNPPLTIDAAQTRLTEVTATVHEIEGRLEFTAPEDYSSDSDHRHWMSRATKALGYWRAERDFLAQWIRSRTSLMSVENETRPGSGLGVIDGDLDSRIENALAYVRERYTPCYSVSNPPGHSAAVRKRIRELQHLSARMETLYGGLRDVAAALHVSEEDLRTRMRPITQLTEQAVEEHRYLRSVRNVANSREVHALLAVIDRAVQNGFVLTPDEASKVTEIRSAPKPEQQ
ncbi:MAG: hypothetical protein WC050_02760 [Candidatus Paceibacterota bacterium]